MAMIVIADSGSTKTTWCILDPVTGSTDMGKTSGINPFYQEAPGILSMLQGEFKLKKAGVDAVYFYGAGCINDKVGLVRWALGSFFHTDHIKVYSDLMGAARSLCGREEGIACILGTGSNSCYYDGKTIVQHVSPLGFILGDEGSGAVLGRVLVGDILKSQLPDYLIKRFFEHYDTTPAVIMDAVYRQPFPNRYLARFTHFISANIDEPALAAIVRNSFDAFFIRNVAQYPGAADLPLHFTGSIALVFQEILKQSAGSFGYRPGKIVSDPMEGLMRYHRTS